MAVLRRRTCPFCGLAHVTIDYWLLCERSLAVLMPIGGERRKFPRRVMEILHMLLLRRGRYTPQHEVFAALWPDPDRRPRGAKKTMPVYMKMLRDMIDGGPLKVRSQHGRGWELVAA